MGFMVCVFCMFVIQALSTHVPRHTDAQQQNNVQNQKNEQKNEQKGHSQSVTHHLKYPPDTLQITGAKGYWACYLGEYGPVQEIDEFYLGDKPIDCRDATLLIYFAYKNMAGKLEATLGYIKEKREDSSCIQIKNGGYNKVCRVIRRFKINLNNSIVILNHKPYLWANDDIDNNIWDILYNDMHFYMLVVWYMGWYDEENNKLIWWNFFKDTRPVYTIVLVIVIWYLSKPCFEESREFVTAAKILVKLRRCADEIEEHELKKKEKEEIIKIVEKKNSLDACDVNTTDNYTELSKCLGRRRKIQK